MKESYSDFELEILNFSLIELLILQTLYQLKRQITRHKLLLLVQHSLGKSTLSTARFYRILTKLEENEFVNHKKIDQSQYFITSKGIHALDKSKTVLDQVGLQVTSFFENDIERIVNFSQYASGKVLFVDFPELFDFELLNIIYERFNELSVLCEDEIYSWISTSFEGIKQTKIDDDTIKEPDNSFDLIVLFYPGTNTNSIIYKELYRILDKNKSLLLLDSISPLETYEHFAVDIMAKKFWRVPFSTKENLELVEKYLITCFNAKPDDSKSIKGLELRLFIKK